MKIKGAIFDMDGTLIDSLAFWNYLWRSIGDRYMSDKSFMPSEEVDKRVRTMIFTDAMVYFKSCYAIPANSDEFTQFASMNLLEFYRDAARVKPGADKLLASLKEKNIKLCLASATAKDFVTYALKRHGLLKYFDSVLSCAEIGVGKDKPDIYLKAKSIMGIPEGEICVFEDSYVALETAKRAGFQTVGVIDKYNFDKERLKKASDFYVDEHETLDELISLIDSQS